MSNPQNQARLEELSETELKNIRLIAEIKYLTRPFYFKPSFWTFIIALTAAVFSIESGLFDVKGEIVKLETLKLETEKTTLLKQRSELLSDKKSLVIQKDSLEIKKAEIQNSISQLFNIEKQLLKRLDSINRINRKEHLPVVVHPHYLYDPNAQFEKRKTY